MKEILAKYFEYKKEKEFQRSYRHMLGKLKRETECFSRHETIIELCESYHKNFALSQASNPNTHD